MQLVDGEELGTITKKTCGCFCFCKSQFAIKLDSGTVVYLDLHAEDYGPQQFVFDDGERG